MSRILLIDDDPDFAQSCQLQLQHLGHQVILAHNPLQGLVKARSAHPDLLIVDVCLPEGQGWTMIESLQRLRLEVPLPLLLISGDSHALAQAQSLTSAPYAALQKPFHREQLAAALGRLLPAPTGAARVLVIDDEPDILDVMELRLQSMGFEVMKAGDGMQGLLAAQRAQPDLILLDVMMPNVDGFEVCRHLKGDVQTQAIPIILFTAKSQMAEPQQWRESRADDIIIKPFDPKDLMAKIEFQLQRVRQRSEKVRDN